MGLKSFILLLFIFLLNSCGEKKQKVSVIVEKDIRLQMIEAYGKGKKALREGDTFYAAKMFNEAELLYPQSEWAPKASLMAAYAYYSQSYYPDAIFELERFIKIYPTSPNKDYAHFMLALCYYETIVDEKKDLGPLTKAKEKFEFIIENYPDTDFALDSKFKIDLVYDILAAKEMYIGKHYLKDRKWIAAINRFKYVIENYERTAHVEEALYRLVEVNYKIGLVEESKRYASILGYNYKSSEWYDQSYRILNPKYVSKLEKIKKEKKRSQNFFIRKIKDILE
ncbi:Beta-barrel assembly machine subunit BamD [Candidatus Pelagibacter ubique]|uniref:Outer membrane protein assembly factor BamD n=1 Tax=Pelagibacter ubique TaxID=198252 RepID=A0ABX1T0F9_PELUQ|nr:outer membrane protein assembly factor BamD [Candidatus Pelagibacter ubique]NMN67598.1 Beta-barrel assembly machine subunit BamD [Candidatus Pelagibacter ubique]